jgi:flagellar hook-associated protein 2
MVTSVSNTSTLPAASTTAAASSSSAASTSSGVSADVYAKVESVMNSQSASVTKVNNAVTADQTKISALGQLQSALADFQSIAQSFSGAGLAMAATSSASSVLSGQTTADSTAGAYAVNVSQLAQAQVLNTASQASPTSAIGTGASTVLTVTTGAAADGTGGTSTKITIDSSNNSLDGIASALQSAGVNAQVVQGANGAYSLTVVGAQGAANSMSIGVSGDSSLQSLLTYPASANGQGMTQTTAAQDAVLTVDGKQITSPGNAVTGAIGGTTLNLTSTGSTTVTVAADSSQIAGNVDKLVSAYNALNTKLQSLQSASGGLQSDTAVDQASDQLARILKSGGNGGVSVAALAQAGVSIDSKGNMTVDDSKLASAVAADPTAVSQLFTNSSGNGIADQMASVVTKLNGDDGVIQTELDRTNTDLTKVTAQKTALGTALTAQANALAALYTQQETDASSSSSGSSSLFDFMA